MNTRYSLVIILGIGIGIIISSSLSIALHKNQKDSYNTQFIKMEAKKIGMIDPEDLFQPRDTKINNSDQDEKSSIVLDIPKGSSSEEIAIILKSNDVIDSEEEFLNRVKAGNLASKLKWGTYQFKADEEIEDVIDALIN